MYQPQLEFSGIFSEPILNLSVAHTDPTLLSPTIENNNQHLLPPPSPTDSFISNFSSSESNPSSDCEDFTIPMDQVNMVKKALRMFPSPMSAKQFIAKNPFIATDGHIKRPSNNFIIFRKIAHDQKNQSSDLTAYNERDFSKIIGYIWKNLNTEEKSIYEKLGKEVAEMHKSLHPQYKYQPKRDKAAWKHFTPETNNQKPKRKNNKIKQQKHQETTHDVPKINIDIPNVPPQNLDYSLPPFDMYYNLSNLNLNSYQFNLFNEVSEDWSQWNMNNMNYN